MMLKSVADTFKVIRCGYHRRTVTFNTKPVTLASTGNVIRQGRSFWHGMTIGTVHFVTKLTCYKKIMKVINWQ